MRSAWFELPSRSYPEVGSITPRKPGRSRIDAPVRSIESKRELGEGWVVDRTADYLTELQLPIG